MTPGRRGTGDPPDRDAAASDTILHASSVAIAGKGLLILGASGAGKSALALQLMAYGATLIADDRTLLVRTVDRLIASAPPAIAGMIEARGVGLLSARPAGPTPIAAAVDLDTMETERLPRDHSTAFLGIRLPLLHAVASPHFAASLLQYMNNARHPT